MTLRVNNQTDDIDNTQRLSGLNKHKHIKLLPLLSGIPPWLLRPVTWGFNPNPSTRAIINQSSDAVNHRTTARRRTRTDGAALPLQHRLNEHSWCLAVHLHSLPSFLYPSSFLQWYTAERCQRACRRTTPACSTKIKGCLIQFRADGFNLRGKRSSTANDCRK